MKKYNSLKMIFMFALIFAFMLPIKSFAFYTEDVIKTVEYTNEYNEWLNLPEEEKQNTIMPRKYEISVYGDNYYSRSRTLEKSLYASKFMASNYDNYDLRKDITVTVKDQGSTGSCWAFATNSAIETNIAKITEENSPLFSARYVEYATSKTFLDGTNPIAYNREVGIGGFTEIALGLYTSGNGPVLEEDLPFENNEDKINLSTIQGLEVQKQVKEYVRFPSIYKSYNGEEVTYTDASGNVYTPTEVEQIRNEIKEHIMKYGAVTSQTYGVGGVTGDARKYYNNPNNVLNSTAYFCNDSSKTSDHQITIIGWDDYYNVSNFNENCRPSTPGAYMVLNSWGESFGENGVYYVSYEDCFIEKDILGIVSTTDIDYDNIYQYDELGNNYAMATYGSIYGANVFKREDTSKNEWLTEISISSLVDTKCEIYVNAEDGELSSSKLKKVADNLELKNGYHTIELETPVKLTGDSFVVAIKYMEDNNKIAYFGIEYPDDYYWNTATAENGQSYLSLDLDNWDDLAELASTTSIPSESNLCIKAFTEYDLEEPKFFELENYSIDDEYIFNISPETKINELTNNILTNMEYYIYNQDGNIVSGEEILATGMELRNETNTYKIVVKGDINGDGKISITDVVKTRLHTISMQILDGEAFKAADITGDGKVTITDLVNINLASIKIKNI